jgi:hypothetical protein
VEAVITNTSTISDAENVVVVLDYNENQAYDWVLMPGEIPTRTVDRLITGTAYHAYWFARYYYSEGATHQYTVTASADNASPVATSENYYNPTGDTVEVVNYISNATSDILQTQAEVVVGVAFTVAIQFDLPTNPGTLTFSPVGNFGPDDEDFSFDPSAYRLLSTDIRIYDEESPPHETTYTDRVYLDTLPGFTQLYPSFAEAIYTFIAVAPENTQVCPYTAVDAAQETYDNTYCVGDAIIPITGTVTLSMTKQVDNPTIQQGQLVTYTIDVTNTGTLTLTRAWV